MQVFAEDMQQLVATIRLGQRGHAVAFEHLSIVAVLRSDGDATLRIDEDLLAVDREYLVLEPAQLRLQPLDLHVQCAGDRVGEQERAALRMGHEAGSGKYAAQSLADLPQALVAECAAAGIVDVGKTPDVQYADNHRPAGLHRLHLFAERIATGQACHGIVVGQVFESFALGDEVRGMVDFAGQPLEQTDFFLVVVAHRFREQGQDAPGLGPQRQRHFRQDAGPRHLLAQCWRNIRLGEVADDDSAFFAERLHPGILVVASGQSDDHRFAGRYRVQHRRIAVAGDDAQCAVGGTFTDASGLESALVDGDPASIVQQFVAVRRAHHDVADGAEHRMDAGEPLDPRFLREPLGIVMVGATVANDPASGVQHRVRRALQDMYAAVAMAPAQRLSSPRPRVLEKGRDAFHDQGAIRRVHQRHDFSAQQFLGAVAKHLLHRAVGVGQAAFAIDFPDPVLACLDDAAEALLAFLKCTFDAVALGDIADEHRVEAALRGIQPRDRCLDREFAAVVPQRTQQARRRLLRQLGLPCLLEVRGKETSRGAAQGCRPRASEHRLGGGVEEDDLPLIVEGDDGIERRLDQTGQARFGPRQTIACALELGALVLEHAHQGFAVLTQHRRLDFLRRGRCARGARVGDGRMQGRHDDFGRCRLRDIGIGTGVAGQFAVGGRVVGAGVEHQRQMVETRQLPHFQAQAITVHARHQDVGHHAVDRFAIEHRQGLDAVGRVEDDMTVRFQLCPQQFEIEGLVVNDQDIHGGSTPRR